MTKIGLVVFFLIIIGYAYFEGRGMLYGPRIDVAPGVQEVQDPFIHISGSAERIASLSMNGKPIAVTEKGNFDEPYLLSPGLNRIILDAKDKYGRTRQRVIEVVFKPGPHIIDPYATASTTTIIYATSTPGTAASSSATSTATTTEIF